jgi:deoxycytidylate deaminase
MGPCAKQVVTATLVTITGARFVGRNDCRAPQDDCPRMALGFARGEGYQLCREICEQPWHAETAAIAAAEAAGGAGAARGGTVWLEGHVAPCVGCQSVVDLLGISVVVGAPPEAPEST